MIDKSYYASPQKNWWQGRTDGETWSQKRWHQVVKPIVLEEIENREFQHSIVLLGFACDEGVARNKGRVGAVEGPKAFRNACCNLPVHFPPEQTIYDAGNIICTNKDLEESQEQLSKIVSYILTNEWFPIVMGGGHEILYGHYGGVRANFPDKKIGVINFDAHFDLRSTAEMGATSGTGFYQIAEDCKNIGKDFFYFAVGIQESGNTNELFERTNTLKIDYVLARNFHMFNLEKIKKQIQFFLAEVDVISLTIDLDVFESAYAPGVSSPTVNGLHYDFVFYEILKCIAQSKKVVSMDIAELNPLFDIDNRTAKLAANILFDWVKLKGEK